MKALGLDPSSTAFGAAMVELLGDTERERQRKEAGAWLDGKVLRWWLFEGKYPRSLESKAASLHALLGRLVECFREARRLGVSIIAYEMPPQWKRRGMGFRHCQEGVILVAYNEVFGQDEAKPGIVAIDPNKWARTMLNCASPGREARKRLAVERAAQRLGFETGSDDVAEAALIALYALLEARVKAITEKRRG